MGKSIRGYQGQEGKHLGVPHTLPNLINTNKESLLIACDFTVKDIKVYKQLKKRLKEAFQSCLNAVALASNQLALNPNKEAPAAFYYKDKLFINASYHPITMAGYRDVLEGCLSNPGHVHQVRRWNAIQASYLYMKQGRLKYSLDTLTGFDAQVFQHEIDHLNGHIIF
jgi:peptide deformylase